MPAESSPSPDDLPQITLDEFERRLAADPTFAAKIRASCEAALALPATPENEPMQTAARATLATFQHHEIVIQAQEKLEAGKAYIRATRADPHGFDVSHLEAIIEETMDLLFDTPEPKRTDLMQKILVVRELFRRLPRD